MAAHTTTFWGPYRTTITMGGCTSFRRKSSMLYDGRAEIASTIHHPRPSIPQQDHYPPSSIFYGPKSRFATYIRPTPPIYPKLSQYGHALNRTNASQARPSPGQRSSGTEFQTSTPNCYGISRATAAQDSPEGHLSKDQSIATVLDDFWDPIGRHPENLDITDLPTSHISNQVCDPRLLGKIPTIGSSLYPNLRTPSQCPNYEPSPFFAQYHQTFAPFFCPLMKGQ